MKSRTKISKQLERKNNCKLVETVIVAKKNGSWNKVAGFLSGPRRKKICFNIEEVDKNSKEGETILIPGKVLSGGDINKKIKIVAFEFSEKAKEKLLSAGCKIEYIINEIKSNPEAKGIKIIK